MSKVSKSTLRGWFESGDKPLSAQFYDWLDSYWHKDEAMSIDAVDGLADALAQLVSTSSFNSFVSSTNSSLSAINAELDTAVLQDGSRSMNADFGFSGNYKVKWSASKYLAATATTLELDTDDTLNIGANADVINIGNGTAAVNIYSATAYTVGESEIEDALIRLNKGGGAGTGIDSGFEIEEAGVVTGYVKVHPTDRTKLVMKVPGISHVVTMDMNGKTAAQTLAFLSDIPSNATIRALISATAPIAYNNSTGVITWTGTTSDVAEGANQYFTETRVRASVLTGLSTTPGTVVAADSILVAIGKLQGNSAQNATNIATKATLGGDSPTGTWRVGTNNAQAAVIRSNNVDRITVDINGNIIVAGTTTNVDLPRVRLRNTSGSYLEALSMAVVSGQLDIGLGATEINFAKPVTNFKGTNTRMGEWASDGTGQAIEEIVPLMIYNYTVQSLLKDNLNWNKGVYTGSSLSTYGLSQGQFFVDSNWYYFMADTVTPVRIPLSNSVEKGVYSNFTYKLIDAAGSASPTVLATYTDTKRLLKNAGDEMVLRSSGKFLGGSGTKRILIKLSGTTAFDSNELVGYGGVDGMGWELEARLIHVSTNNQLFQATLKCSYQGSYQVYTKTIRPTIATDSDIIYELSGVDASNGNYQCIDHEGTVIRFKPFV